MMVSALLPDYGFWRTDNTFNRVSTATALVLGTNHFLDSQPLYFLSQLDKGSSQYDMYLAKFQHENLEHLEDLTVHYDPAPNATRIDDAPHGTNATETLHESPYSSTTLIEGLWKLLSACKCLLALSFGIFFAQVSHAQLDRNFVTLIRRLGKMQEELVISNFRKTYHGVTSVNRLAVIYPLRLRIRALKQKLDETIRRNAHLNASVHLLREELAKVKVELAKANDKLSTSSSTTDSEVLISSLRADINTVNDALAEAKEQQAATATELAKYTGNPSPIPSTSSAAATPPKFSVDAAVFHPSKPPGPPSAVPSPIPSFGSASRIPAPTGQSTTGPIGNKHNAPLGPNGKPIRHGLGFGGRSNRARDHKQNADGSYGFAANYFGPNTFPGSQPGPINYPNYTNPFSFGGNGGSQPGDGSGGYGGHVNFESPGGFQGFGSQGQ